jgi:CheY-like chemotaxis protein
MKNGPDDIMNKDELVAMLAPDMPWDPAWDGEDCPTWSAPRLFDKGAQYAETGGRIDLMMEVRTEEAVVRVRDNGIGLSAHLLSHICDFFVQGGALLDRSQRELGFGLTMVRHWVEKHGGRLEERSIGPGGGGEFVIHLLGIKAAASAHGSESGGGGAVEKTPGIRVLVVDDNVDSAESMALLLSLDGHEVRTAFDGPGALARAAEFGPEAVLLDIGLPGMDGYEVARRMRELPGLENALMIAITGYGQDDDRARSRAAGFDHHLVKPVDPEALSALLDSLVKGR